MKEDWDIVKHIYALGIATGNATFEHSVPTYEKWISSGVPSCILVACREKEVIGWCKLTQTSNRYVYRGVGEVSVYVHPSESGKGIGDILLKELIKRSENNGFWTLTAGIFPENVSSIRLHKKHGFEELGIRKKIGKMQNGTWRDVLQLERRCEM